jgi:Uma2 family endonuclease
MGKITKTRKKQRLNEGTLTYEVAELFPRQGEWTEVDYLSLPETNRLVELSDGRLVVLPMPTDTHQRIVGKLFRLMSDYVEANRLGEVRVAPLRTRLRPGKFREPDIMFMSVEHSDRIGEDYWGVPDLVVEVILPRTEISSRTEHIDQSEKFEDYQKAGVNEYWIVDPEDETIEVYVLRHGAYHLLGKWKRDEIARSKILRGFSVPIDSVFSKQ